jgi:hypothetical protein
MPEPLRPTPVPRRNDEREDRPDSWKVRTVQGWEKNEALPIHRYQHARPGSVYAFKPELDARRESRKGVVESQVPLDEAASEATKPARRSRYGSGRKSARHCGSISRS